MGKTIQVATDRAFDDSSSVVPAEYARGLYVKNAPGALALKLMHLMISVAGGRMGDPVKHEIRLADIRAVKGMKNHDRKSLTPLFEELRGAVLSYDDPEAMKYTIGGFLDHAEIDYRHEVTGDVLLSWEFGGLFRRMAAESDHWAILDRQTVYALTSKYAILLFQHFASLQNLQAKTAERFTIPQLRSLLGVPDGKLERFANLNKWALKPAIAEVNQLARFTLSVTLHKTGRTVTTVEIGWQPKPDMSDTKRELKTSRVGRAERRRGAVEHVEVVPSVPAPKAASTAFPAHGSLKHGDGVADWLQLAEKHVKRLPGGHLPDLAVFADQFRAFCKDRSIPLDAANIEKPFVGFCKKYNPPG